MVINEPNNGLKVNHLKLSFSEKIFRRVSVSLPTEKITKEYQEKKNLLSENTKNTHDFFL